MKIDLSFLAAAVAAVLLAVQGARAFAAEELKPHQQRMKTCNTQADQKGLKAGERNHFMRSCLKGGNGNGRKLSTHQKRNQECTRQAREQGMHGAERRGFMSQCEKPPAAQQTADKEKTKSCNRRADGRRLEGEERRKYLNGCLNGSAAAGG